MQFYLTVPACDPLEFVMDYPNCIKLDWVEDSTSQAMFRVLCTTCYYFERFFQNGTEKIIDIAIGSSVFETPLFLMTFLKCVRNMTVPNFYGIMGIKILGFTQRN